MKRVLTTFQIFLAAIREVSAKLGMPEIGEAVRNYLFNQPMSGDTDQHAKFKLIPTPEDRDIFHIIVEGGLNTVRKKHPEFFYQNGNVRKGVAPNAVLALMFFTDRIEAYARLGIQDDTAQGGQPFAEDQEGQHRRLRSLLEALMNHLKLVVITLDETDDAQVIFETLNSKAEPLLAMDLVRNNIFHRAAAQGEAVETLFAVKWRPFDAPFWKADAPRAKPSRPRIDHFLSHALAAQTGEEISLKELYTEYRAFTRPKGHGRFATVEQELDALIAFAPIYRSLEEGGADPELSAFGSKLGTWEVSTAYPLVFCIATSDADAAVKTQLYRFIYSYLVRRAVCGLTAKNLNKTFQRLVASMLEHGTSIKTFTEAFYNQLGPAVRFPADKEFKSAFRKNPVCEWFSRKERLSDVLWELECGLRTKYSISAPRPANLSIEHVMPQAWALHWPLTDDSTPHTESSVGSLGHHSRAEGGMSAAIAARQDVLHTFGNLTLVTVPANSAASNSSFDNKKAWLKQSLLAMNQAIVETSVWSEREIAARSNELASLAILIWPAPELPYSDEDYEEIVSAQIVYKPAPFTDGSTQPSEEGFSDRRYDVRLPKDFLIERTYKGTLYQARAINGGWKLEHTGQIFPTLQSLGQALNVGTENAWANWFFTDQTTAERRPVSALRDQSKIHTRKR